MGVLLLDGAFGMLRFERRRSCHSCENEFEFSELKRSDSNKSLLCTKCYIKMKAVDARLSRVFKALARMKSGATQPTAMENLFGPSQTKFVEQQGLAQEDLVGRL